VIRLSIEIMCGFLTLMMEQQLMGICPVPADLDLKADLLETDRK
jgi:hypothetical protein